MSDGTNKPARGGTPKFWPTKRRKRTTVATRGFVFGHGQIARYDERPHPLGRRHCQPAKRVIEGDSDTTAGLAIEKRPFGNETAKHFFEAQGLGAELHLIGTVTLGPTTFVFDREGARGMPLKFDNIGNAMEPVTQTCDLYPAQNPPLSAPFGLSAVGTAVHLAALGGEAVLGP